MSGGYQPEARSGTSAAPPRRPSEGDRHSHYFKPCPYDHVDVYRVLEMFGVADPCIQHAAKKLLVAGGRGHKDISRDVQDAIDTLEREHGDIADHPLSRTAWVIGFAVLWPAFVCLGVWDWIRGEDHHW